MIRLPPRSSLTATLFPHPPLSRSVPGNALYDSAREGRLARFFRPYHDHIVATIAAHRPAMILSLHSFTPSLAAHPDQARPWHVGVLYNEDDRLAAAAIDRKSTRLNSSH